MRVLVCIKQVPARSVPMENGLLRRSGAGGQLNPRDYYALEAALQIGQTTGGEVTALTMGPESAGEVLKTAFSMGVAQGILLTDRAFSGADVYATARTLAETIRVLGQFDVIVCGQQTSDGDTALVPFSLAEQLKIPVIGWVKKLKIKENQLILQQELSGGTQEACVSPPCLIAVGEGIGTPRIPSLRDQLKARKKEPEVLHLENLQDPNPEHYGLHRSPTRVVKAFEAQQKVGHKPVTADAAAETIWNLISTCEEGKTDGES